MDQEDRQCIALTLVAAYARLQTLQVDLDRSDNEETEYRMLIDWWEKFPLPKKAKVCNLVDQMAGEEVEGISLTIGRKKPDRKIILVCIAAYAKMLELRVKHVVNIVHKTNDIETSKRLEYWWSDMDNYRRGVLLNWVTYWQDGYEMCGRAI